MAWFLVQGKRVAIAPAVLAGIYYGLGAVAQEKLGPCQCNAEFPVHYFYAWLDQYFPKLYMRLPLHEEVSPPAGIGLGLDRTPANKTAMGSYQLSFRSSPEIYSSSSASTGSVVPSACFGP
ncbi:hypothetical protein TIFTF001_008927 [Ficus carica]|uniref:Uncharacterized protein n=1 Tax=Ficus carica TaxID=3494 RepID=A0AA88AG04_FICCA|nr:hypothetical protein TIFTF001_008927 [Ficus carica]